jgi:hypothetical protein
MNEELMEKAEFEKELEQISLGRCPLCAKDIKENDFKDALSRKEFQISRMCQECQDGIFE